mgnify:CR=1 FL=1
MSKEANNDSPTPFSGLGLIQEGQALAERIEGQSWVSPSLNSLSPGGGSGSFSMGPVELLSRSLVAFGPPVAAQGLA